MRPALFVAILLGCGPGNPGGPSMNNHMGDVPDTAPDIQSNDILARDAVTKKAVVKHILVSWRDLAKNYEGKIDPRGAARSRAEADALAGELLKRVRAGEDMDALMAQYSEDQGSAKSGRPYDVTPDAKLVFEFKRLSLRLNPGEAGLVQTTFGWHIIKRLE